MTQQSRQERAFTVYLALGPSRSLSLLRQELRSNPASAGLRRAPSLRSLEVWSARHGWQKRVASIEREAREQAEREYVEWVQEHRQRLRQEGLLLQRRGIEWLEEKQAGQVTAGEAIRAIDAGFKLEALALGQATERVTLEANDERLERLTDEELEVIISYARRVEPDGASGEGEAPA